jgi:hypothetical protein
MNTNRVIAVAVGFGLMLASLTVVAHHSVSAELDTSKRAGRKARTGRASRDRGESQGLIDTLRVIGAGYTQHRDDKTASGGSATALPRSLERIPRELKTQEGTRVTAGPKKPAGHCGLRSGSRP